MALISGEIGSAFVRIRPNATGFKSETEAGVRSGLSGVSKIIAGAFAVGAVAEFGKTVVRAAEQEQVAITKTKRAVQDANLGWFTHKKAIEETIQAQARAKGFMEHDLYDAFANMIRTTGSVSGALKLNSLAMDIARTKGMDLGSAQSLLARVYNGSFMGLKRLGIAITPVTTAQDKLKTSSKDFIAAELILAKAHGTHGLALQMLKEKLSSSAAAQITAAKADDKRATAQQALALATQKFSGQAAAYAHTAAGAQDRLSEAMNELEATAGKKLLPIIADLATELAGELPAALKEVQADTQAVSGFFKEYGSVIEPVAGSILGLVVALKAYSVASRLANAATMVGKGLYQSVTSVFVSQQAAVAKLADANAAAALATGNLEAAEVARTGAIQAQIAAQAELQAAQASEFTTETEIAGAETRLIAARVENTIATANYTRALEAQQVAAMEAAAAQRGATAAVEGMSAGAVLGGIGLVIGALVTLYQTSGTVRSALNSIGAMFKSDEFSAGAAAKAVDEYRKALDDLKHDQQGITDAQDRLAEAKLQVQHADARLTQLQSEGKKGTLEYKDAQLQLRESYHAVHAAILDVNDAEKKRNLTVGAGNKGISEAWNQGVKLSATSAEIAKMSGNAGKGLQVFSAGIQQMIEKAGGSKTPLGEALQALQRLSQATGKPPSSAEWDRVFAHLTTLPNKALTKAQRDAEAGANRIGNAITTGIIAGVGDLSTPLGNYISQQIQAAYDSAGQAHHGSGPFQDTIHLIGAPMAKGVIDGWNSEIAGLPGVMSQTLRDSVMQAQDSVVQEIGQAKQNLAGIGGSIAGMVGDIFNAAGQKQSLKDALTSAKTNLANLDVAGGTPQQLAAARAAVKAAQGAIDQAALQRRFADLSDELGRGQITKKQFNRDVDQMLGRLGLSYAKLKKEMGIAFADQYRAEVQGLKAQAGAIVAGPRRPDITGFEPQIVKPLDAVAQGTQQVRDAVKSAASAALSESKKQTAHLKKIEQSSADAAFSQRYIDTHPRPGVNPNHSAGRAKKKP